MSGANDWDVAEGDGSRVSMGMLDLEEAMDGDHWTFVRAQFLLHQWVCPVAHYGRYRARERELEKVVVTGAEGEQGPTQILPREGCEALGELPEVSSITLKGVVMDDALVSVLARRAGLNKLVLENCEMSDAQLEGIGVNASIMRLELFPGRALRSESLVALSKWRGLTRVTVQLPRFEVWRGSGDALAVLIQSPSVKELRLLGRVQLDQVGPVAGAFEKSGLKMGPGCVFVLRPGEINSHVKEVLDAAGVGTEVMDEGAEEER